MQSSDGKSSEKSVKVRINVSGSRYVGYVRVLPPKTRISDVLNEDKPFMTLWEVDSVDPVSKDAKLLINKKQVSYVQALEEFKRNYTGIHSGTFVDVKIRAIDYLIAGKIFLPTHLLNTDRAELLTLTPFFLNVKDASVTGTHERYTFMAVSKNQIRSIEIA